MNDNDTLADDLRKDSLALMRLLADEKHKSEALAAELAGAKSELAIAEANRECSSRTLNDRIRALEAELAVEKMQHSVTIADEHESRSEFQDRLGALEANLAAELALRQTAEGYAARNALRVIEVESVLRSAHAELTDHGHQELPECECRIAHVLAGSQTETKSAPGFCPECLMTGGHKLRCSKAETFGVKS